LGERGMISFVFTVAVSFCLGFLLAAVLGRSG
jgi:hypothetical protein